MQQYRSVFHEIETLNNAARAAITADQVPDLVRLKELAAEGNQRARQALEGLKAMEIHHSSKPESQARAWVARQERKRPRANRGDAA